MTSVLVLYVHSNRAKTWHTSSSQPSQENVLSKIRLKVLFTQWFHVRFINLVSHSHRLLHVYCIFTINVSSFMLILIICFRKEKKKKKCTLLILQKRKCWITDLFFQGHLKTSAPVLLSYDTMEKNTHIQKVTCNTKAYSIWIHIFCRIYFMCLPSVDIL